VERHKTELEGKTREHEYKSKGLTAIYLSSNQFFEEMIAAIRNGTNAEFREKYHQVDVLLIDRLQYIAGKEATQEELFNIVEKRLLDHKQTVFSGNVHPSQIPILNPELSACLAGGLCIEIPTPDFEGKMQIISQKLKAHGMEWPIEACRYVALNTSSGVNQIDGEINKILFCKELL
jgi:chromosomal replication initiator protein